MKDNDIIGALLAAAILDSEKKNEQKEQKDLRTKSKELGEKIKQSMYGFMDAGFTEEQAFQLAIAIKRG
ncbi:MAG: hypothetical protein J6S14_10880 [Clostridia bacterium]|nr:hypothetical protein [Clostridia bacterium]